MTKTERVALAKAKAKKLVDAAKAKAKKLVDAAKAKAKKLVDAAKDSAPKKPTSKRKDKKPMTPAQQELCVLNAVKSVARGSSGLIEVVPVRIASGLDKATFDATALRLCAKSQLILHDHDHPTSLSERKRAELIEGKSGRVFVGLALPPSRATDDRLILSAARLYGPGKAVRIASLRADVGLLPSVFNAALRELHSAGKVALYRDDNRATQKAEGAYMVEGEPRHILYVK